MKTYMINNNCIYNERNHELRSISNSLVIKMTAMRARCLSFIIENAQMDVIERQQLTTALWGSRGNFVNDANLTQILYLIRRDLKSLGVNDFLITVPRKGIQVNNQIPVKPIDNKTGKRWAWLNKTPVKVMLTVAAAAVLAAACYVNIH
ncbi:transcriptional regulator [Superficieibacter sp. 1612_C1]|uniref:winged helix-turn-helix domain-containing protein n=1 Tax=Superficieibacter sp. 1612_C1 TaxID=2780382 RepID=UPI001D16D936|nr:transcriptional regulator [Superficieibacter sp. 1612_C1]MDU2938177.1 transcriptional regulator [Enterobacteriaceae bacterium]